MSIRKTHVAPKHILKKHRIKIRIVLLALVAIVIMVIEGIDRHRAMHLAAELTLVAPIDKLADLFVFGGE
jgi:hypothetical protein